MLIYILRYTPSNGMGESPRKKTNLVEKADQRNLETFHHDGK